MKSRNYFEGLGPFQGGRHRPITKFSGSWADQEQGRPRVPLSGEEERMRRAGRVHPDMQSPEAQADSARAGRPTGRRSVRETNDWGPTPQRPRQLVKVTFADGDVIETPINGTEEEIRAYYAPGREFNIGSGPDDNMQKVVKVEFPNGLVAVGESRSTDDYGEPVGEEGLRRFRTNEPGQGGGDVPGEPNPQSTAGVLLGSRGYALWSRDMRERGEAVPSWDEGTPYNTEATPTELVDRLLEDGEAADGPAKWDTPPPHQPFGGWRQAFLDFPETDLPKEILDGVASGALVDVSKPGGGSPAFALAEVWGPDTSIMFNHTFPSTLYVQAADPDGREEPDLKRFYVVSGDDSIDASTDDIMEALAALRGEAEEGRGLDPAEGPTGADEGSTGDEVMAEAAAVVGRLIAEEDDMDTYLMGDQPACCPKCGRRIVTWLSGQETNKQVVRCEPCKYTYRLEADDEEEAPKPPRKLNFRKERDDVGGGFGRSDY